MPMESLSITHKVKLLYGLGYGTTGIVQVLTIGKEVIELFCKGSATMGPSQVIMLDHSYPYPSNKSNGWGVFNM